MILETIQAHQFRNLSGNLYLGPRLNIIFGSNGQGKTNWLEAIYLLSRTKSFRTQRLQEGIRFGHETAFVRGLVARGAEVRRDLQLTIQGNVKTISINGKRETLARYLGQLQVFSFTAAELEVVRGVPEARRRFIDRGVASLQPGYVQTVSDYIRVIKQKNRILQDANEQGLGLVQVEDLVAPWNQQIVGLASEIHQARSDYIKSINEVLERGLFEQRDVHINYISSLAGKGDLDDYRALISQRLGLRMQAELAAGRSLIGPHRDDLEVLLEGREMRVFGSSGQQRSALLLLDLASISLYNSSHGDYPLFLIDDVDAELDERRIRHLLEYLESRTQTFITTSKRTYLEDFLSRANVYEIVEGAVLTGQSQDQPAREILAPLETT
ncbi:MAG TPA: DNA replication and repair protein RecF [Pyrinomonadaceae bacterium]|nr:DNA replication and repair protein RecF [Pyrinomonadaceae bacterium]